MRTIPNRNRKRHRDAKRNTFANKDKSICLHKVRTYCVVIGAKAEPTKHPCDIHARDHARLHTWFNCVLDQRRLPATSGRCYPKAHTQLFVPAIFLWTTSEANNECLRYIWKCTEDTSKTSGPYIIICQRIWSLL